MACEFCVVDPDCPDGECENLPEDSLQVMIKLSRENSSGPTVKFDDEKLVIKFFVINKDEGINFSFSIILPLGSMKDWYTRDIYKCAKCGGAIEVQTDIEAFEQMETPDDPVYGLADLDNNAKFIENFERVNDLIDFLENEQYGDNEFIYIEWLYEKYKISSVSLKSLLDMICNQIDPDSMPKNEEDLKYEDHKVMYKAFDNDLKDELGAQYAVGETYITEEAKLYESGYDPKRSKGFHACIDPVNISNTTANSFGDPSAITELRLCEVHLYGDIASDEKKDIHCATDMYIAKEIDNPLEFILNKIRKDYSNISGHKMITTWEQVSTHIHLTEETITEFADNIDWTLASRYQNLSDDHIRMMKDKIIWEDISRYQKLSNEIMKECRFNLIWESICQYQDLSEEFLTEMIEIVKQDTENPPVFEDNPDTEDIDESTTVVDTDYLKWSIICEHQRLSEQFIETNKDLVNWTVVSKHQTLSEKFIKKFKDRVNWDKICEAQKLSEKFMEEMLPYISWTPASHHQRMSEKFIYKYKDLVDWKMISKYKPLSESFIRRMKDYIVWSELGEIQELSENFIREFKDKVNWTIMSEYQVLSEDFIREFEDYVDWKAIFRFQELSDEFREEFKEKLEDEESSEDEEVIEEGE